MASRASEKMNKSPCSSHCGLAALPLAAGGDSCDIAIAYIEGIVVYSSAARDYILAAVPSGAAQEARYPAGTLGDVQAVTACQWVKSNNAH